MFKIFTLTGNTCPIIITGEIKSRQYGWLVVYLYFFTTARKAAIFLSIIERVLIIHVKILVVIPCWITKLKKLTNLSGSKGSVLTIFGRLWNDCKFFVYLHLICTQQLIAPAAWSDFIINSLLKFRFEVIWKMKAIWSEVISSGTWPKNRVTVLRSPGGIVRLYGMKWYLPYLEYLPINTYGYYRTSFENFTWEHQDQNLNVP